MRYTVNVNARSLNNEKLDELQVLVSDFNVSVVCHGNPVQGVYGLL